MIPFDVAYRMPHICFDVEVNTDLSGETTTCMVHVHNRSLAVFGLLWRVHTCVECATAGESSSAIVVHKGCCDIATTTRLYECIIRGIGSGGWSLPVWHGGCVVSSRVRVSIGKG